MNIFLQNENDGWKWIIPAVFFAVAVVLITIAVIEKIVN